MPDISVHRSHDLGLADAKSKVDDIIADIQKDFGDLVNNVAWNSDGTVADVTGKAFKGKFSLGEDKVGIDVDLAFFAKPLKKKIQSQIEERMTRYFG
jgi:putative polyhydroxyalkanoate system protein